MITNLRMNKILWITTAALALGSSIAGAVYPQLYQRVASDAVMPGIFGQDLMTVAASLVAMVLAITMKARDYRKQIVVLGILGFFFYAYGIYVIERLYTFLYYPYLIIWALSFWSLIYGVSAITREAKAVAELPRVTARVSAGFSMLVAIVFTILWVTALLPLIRTGEKIEFTYSVYILDLCIIMPAFAVLGAMAYRRSGLSFILMPAMFVLGFVLIFSLAVSEALVPLYGRAVNISAMVQSLVLALLFLFMAVLDIRKLKFG